VGDEITYTISFTMPSDIEGFESVKIVDTFPAALSYKTNSAALKIGSGTAAPITINTATAGELSYEITGSAFSALAGQIIELTLVFEVTDTSAKINNKAELYFKPSGGTYPTVPDAEDGEDIVPPISGSITDFEKNTADIFEDAGDELTYTISFTVPADLTNYEALKIVDIFPAASLSFKAGSALLSIDGAASTAVTMNDAVAGELSYEITGSDFTDLAGKSVELTLVFEVLDPLLPITNRAELYVKPSGDPYPPDPDDETEVENDPYIGPPTSATAAGQNKKVLLQWKAPVFDTHVDSYQVKIDGGSWIDIPMADLNYHSGLDSYYYMFSGLTNGVEYTFWIRALNSASIAGEEVELKATPLAIGELGGTETDLLSVFGISVMPSGGWSSDSGTQWSNAHEVIVVVPRSVAYAFITILHIAASTDAAVEMYSDFIFMSREDIIYLQDDDLEWFEELHIYVKVISANGENWAYYDVVLMPT
jgi:fimbrial isopeptide formation D2 family protein